MRFNESVPGAFSSLMRARKTGQREERRILPRSASLFVLPFPPRLPRPIGRSLMVGIFARMHP